MSISTPQNMTRSIWPPWPPARLDIHALPFDSHRQLERAYRALARFRGFGNEPAFPDAIRELDDSFLEAAEASWHVKDHIRWDLDEMHSHPELIEAETLARAELKRIEALAHFNALRDIANASKHRTLRDQSFEGPIYLERMFDESETTRLYLADVYASAKLMLNGDAMHPAAFLHGINMAWEAYIREHLRLLVGVRLTARLSGQSALAAR